MTPAVTATKHVPKKPSKVAPKKAKSEDVDEEELKRCKGNKEEDEGDETVDEGEEQDKKVIITALE